MKFNIAKKDDEKRQVFGWASIAKDQFGKSVVDLQEDIIDPEELETAVYEYINLYGDMGENHNPELKFKGKVIESVVFTKAKQEAMKIPSGILPEGWWLGFQVNDDKTWEKVKRCDYEMFSIEGTAERHAMNKTKTVAKTFSEIFNACEPSFLIDEQLSKLFTAVDNNK